MTKIDLWLPLACPEDLHIDLECLSVGRRLEGLERGLWRRRHYEGSRDYYRALEYPFNCEDYRQVRHDGKCRRPLKGH